ncbi:GNAT family N-acetyltransferase [Kosakonia cowanii]|uniref:GNAT family N-acetyltransferase n=1 Tax=Kosakonia cowanii TaxID=208223 RepID=UPI0023F96722|nr:GNAT family N-acetyltransferase [Kosakonia cowanii]MDF7760601.1 GNAT family N-acetyltransferase [Kosakonia cowanii]
MAIRLAHPEEAPVIWHIRNAAIRHGCKGVYADEVIAAWTPEAMPQGQVAMIRENPFYVALSEEGQPVATGFLDIATGSIEAIFTLPAWEGHGMATRILDVLKQEALRRGFSHLRLAATPNACIFYQKRGFAVVQESVYHSQLAKADLRCIEMVYPLSGE